MPYGEARDKYERRRELAETLARHYGIRTAKLSINEMVDHILDRELLIPREPGKLGTKSGDNGSGAHSPARDN